MLSSKSIYKKMETLPFEKQKKLLNLLAQEEKIDKNGALQRAWTLLNEKLLYKQLVEEFVNYNIETLSDTSCVIYLSRTIAGTDAFVIEQKQDYYEITTRGLSLPIVRCHNLKDMKIIIDNGINNLCLKQKEYNRKRRQKRKNRKLKLKTNFIDDKKIIT